MAACAVAKFPVAALETNCDSEECAGSANRSGECEKGERERERARETEPKATSLYLFHLHPLLPYKISLTLLFAGVKWNKEDEMSDSKEWATLSPEEFTQLQKYIDCKLFFLLSPSR